MRNPPAAKATRAPRRPALFWAPLNDWWRGYLAEKGRRPVTAEVQVWYNEHAENVWGAAKPVWREARIHAKCLRSTEQVKNYFREYRARGKGGGAGGDGDERPARRRASRDDDAGPGPRSSEGTASGGIKEEEEDDAVTGTASGARYARGSGLWRGSGAQPSLLRGPGRGGSAGGASAASDGGAGEAAMQPGGFVDPSVLNANLPPTTVTTGNGLPPAWQHRSASERFARGPASAAFGGAGDAGGAGPGSAAEQQALAWDRSHSSVIFRPPSMSLHAKKPLSPFILTQGVKAEPGTSGMGMGEGADAADAGVGPVAGSEHGTGARPGSPMLAALGKAQSFSGSSKRRYMGEDAAAAPGAGTVATAATPPSSLYSGLRQHAASFSHGGHGGGGGGPHGGVSYYSNSPTMAYGVPVREGEVSVGRQRQHQQHQQQHHHHHHHHQHQQQQQQQVDNEHAVFGGGSNDAGFGFLPSAGAPSHGPSSSQYPMQPPLASECAAVAGKALGMVPWDSGGDEGRRQRQQQQRGRMDPRMVDDIARSAAARSREVERASVTAAELGMGMGGGLELGQGSGRGPFAAALPPRLLQGAAPPGALAAGLHSLPLPHAGSLDLWSLDAGESDMQQQRHTYDDQPHPLPRGFGAGMHPGMGGSGPAAGRWLGAPMRGPLHGAGSDPGALPANLRSASFPSSGMHPGMHHPQLLQPRPLQVPPDVGSGGGPRGLPGGPPASRMRSSIHPLPPSGGGIMFAAPKSAPFGYPSYTQQQQQQQQQASHQHQPTDSSSPETSPCDTFQPHAHLQQQQQQQQQQPFQADGAAYVVQEGVGTRSKMLHLSLGVGGSEHEQQQQQQQQHLQHELPQQDSLSGLLPLQALRMHSSASLMPPPMGGPNDSQQQQQQQQQQGWAAGEMEWEGGSDKRPRQVASDAHA